MNTGKPELPAAEPYTTAQLAKKLGRNPQTLRVWRMNNKGPKWKRHENGKVIYEAADVAAWETEQK